MVRESPGRQERQEFDSINLSETVASVEDRDVDCERVMQDFTDPENPDNKPRNGNDDAERQPPPPATSETAEFEDEPPGSYLAELQVGTANVVWSGLNLLLTLALGLGRLVGGLSPQSSWWTVTRLLWALLPASCLLLLVVTVWQILAGQATQGRREGGGCLPLLLLLGSLLFMLCAVVKLPVLFWVNFVLLVVAGGVFLLAGATIVGAPRRLVFLSFGCSLAATCLWLWFRHASGSWE